MLLSAALEEKDILFRQQSYPDQVSIEKKTFFTSSLMPLVCAERGGMEEELSTL
jgi:hypothetical protein